MGLLEAVMQKKQQERAIQQRNTELGISLLGQAIEGIENRRARQQAQDLAQRQFDLNAAKGGFRVGPGGELIKDPSLQDPLSQFLTQGKILETQSLIQGLERERASQQRADAIRGTSLSPQEQESILSRRISGEQAPLTSESVPTGAISSRGFVEKEFKEGDSKFLNLGAVEQEKMLSEITKSSAESLKNAVDGNKNFNTTAQLMSGLVSQAKAKGEEQGGLGLGAGIIGGFNSFFKNPDFSATASFPGQKRETALALNRVITGQNRVIKGVVQMINETLPDEFDPGPVIAQKIAQSLTNAYKLTKAINDGVVSVDKLDKLRGADQGAQVRALLANEIALSPKEQKELDNIIKTVLDTPAEKKRQLPGFENKSGNNTLKTNSGITFQFEEITNA